MVTEIFQRQIGKEIEFIFDEENLMNFLSRFFDHIKEDIEYRNVNVFVAFATDFLYIQLTWFDDDGEQTVYEYQVDYESYNEWRKNVSKR